MWCDVSRGRTESPVHSLSPFGDMVKIVERFRRGHMVRPEAVPRQTVGEFLVGGCMIAVTRRRAALAVVQWVM